MKLTRLIIPVLVLLFGTGAWAKAPAPSTTVPPKIAAAMLGASIGAQLAPIVAKYHLVCYGDACGTADNSHIAATTWVGPINGALLEKDDNGRIASFRIQYANKKDARRLIRVIEKHWGKPKIIPCDVMTMHNVGYFWIRDKTFYSVAILGGTSLKGVPLRGFTFGESSYDPGNGGSCNP
jgi:hypothetical protein